MPESPVQSVSSLLAKWQAGDEEAMQTMLPVVYKELRRVAHCYLRKERPDHTLQSTELVHEGYLRLLKQGGKDFKNRAHFLAICAQLMRQILVEHARKRQAAKRDGGRKVVMEDELIVVASTGMDVIALDDALRALAELDSQQSRIVELRFFGGLSIEETAQTLGVSPATVKRDWAIARVWLHHEISKRKT